MLSAITLPAFTSLSTIVGDVASQQGYPAGNPSGSGILPMGAFPTTIPNLQTIADDIVSTAQAAQPPPPKESSTWKWLAGGAAILVLGGGIYYATRRKKR